MATNKTETLRERTARFFRDHAEYESQWARNILHNLTEFLPFVFEFEAVAGGIAMMYRQSGVSFPEDVTWAGADEMLPLSELRKVKIYQLALSLRAYAYYGIVLPAAHDAYDHAEFLEFLELRFVPSQWGQDEEMEAVILAAQGRRKLDFPNRGSGLRPEELAALAQIEKKSVLNMLTPARREREGLELDATGRISLNSALRWLASRPNFSQSVWQEGGAVGQSTIDKPIDKPVVAVEPVFVPVAADGLWFSPEARTVSKNGLGARYHVGNGETEEAFDEYWPALSFLARAGSPRWRYRDEGSRWRMKTATSWTRKAREDIEASILGGAAIGGD